MDVHSSPQGPPGKLWTSKAASQDMLIMEQMQILVLGQLENHIWQAID